MTILFLGACGQSALLEESDEKESLNVVTTFYPVFEFASQVVGDYANVTVILEAGQDSHHYEPSPKDLAAIYDADVFIYSSEYMETWVPAVLDNLLESDVKIIEASQGIPFYEEDSNEEEEDHDHEGHSHIVDPHIWLDPVYASQMVETISEEMQVVDEEHSKMYEENAGIYQSELKELDRQFQEAFEGAASRTFVVQHAAFGYLARRYDLNQVSVSSLTSEQEISPAKLAEIGTFINENQIQTIYYQDSASAKVAETLAKETDTNLEVLYTIEGVTLEEQDEGIDYLHLMQSNIEALKTTIK
ncbi:zinc ABC transporter substrate-binding protein [Jeotgalibaca sp. MA1X17-3]|uniref:metal ABC transporter solute-binding protein, Zn/Mn family n=1 Tax=Jeotgalibaca sp. MA1X17-3 TaxID=2908211 RepID=UPI001F35C981|nr:zinc ABC transporter substrate-binding protein [Jeotgalibaca sp. MA1X17-3]UJF16195.1 zinc ABC transporter substrate-binding protein [Jeotgalibaca sp. MA1X17-3]